MATMKKAQAGIKKAVSKMVPGEMTGKMYKKSAIDAIGDKQAKELDKVSMLGKAAMAKKKAPKFDPNKKYTWEYGAEFVLNGKDFGMILNALRAVINTKEAQTILLAKQAGDALEEVLEHAVNAGVVVELPENKASL